MQNRLTCHAVSLDNPSRPFLQTQDENIRFSAQQCSWLGSHYVCPLLQPDIVTSLFVHFKWKPHDDG